jgi:hypothetical protein
MLKELGAVTSFEALEQVTDERIIESHRID